MVDKARLARGVKNKNDKFLPLGCPSARAPPLPRPLRPLSSAERTQPPRRRRSEDGRTSEAQERERSVKKNALLIKKRNVFGKKTENESKN